MIAPLAVLTRRPFWSCGRKAYASALKPPVAPAVTRLHPIGRHYGGVHRPPVQQIGGAFAHCHIEFGRNAAGCNRRHHGFDCR